MTIIFSLWRGSDNSSYIVEKEVANGRLEMAGACINVLHIYVLHTINTVKSHHVVPGGICGAIVY